MDVSYRGGIGDCPHLRTLFPMYSKFAPPKSLLKMQPLFLQHVLTRARHLSGDGEFVAALVPVGF
jgi:hypothetical protein